MEPEALSQVLGLQPTLPQQTRLIGSRTSSHKHTGVGDAAPSTGFLRLAVRGEWGTLSQRNTHLQVHGHIYTARPIGHISSQESIYFHKRAFLLSVLHSPGSRAPHFKVYTFPKTLKCFPMEIPLSSKSPGNLECVSLRDICIQSNDGNITFYHCIYTCNGNYIYYYTCNGNKHLIMYQLCVTLKNFMTNTVI